MLKHFVKYSWLREHLDDSEVFILDIRYQKNVLGYGRKVYEESHIPGAEFLSWEDVFVKFEKYNEIVEALPSVENFEHIFSEIGFDKRQTLVLYGNSLREVARAWFICKYMGIEKVKILEGGWEIWADKNGPIENFTPVKRPKTHFKSKLNKNMICDTECVLLKKDKDNVALIDTRAHSQYVGEEEDLHSGHIEGARNYYWYRNLEIERDNTLLKHTQLEEIYRCLEDAEEIIVYSNSSISACVNYLGLEELGYNVTLYLGGILKWRKHPEGKMKRGIDESMTF